MASASERSASSPGDNVYRARAWSALSQAAARGCGIRPDAPSPTIDSLDRGEAMELNVDIGSSSPV